MSQEYFSKNKHVSASLLKTLAFDPQSAKRMLDGEIRETTLALELGSLFDEKITQPEIVADKYHIVQSARPTDKMLDWSNAYLDLFLNLKSYDVSEETQKSLILQAREVVQYNSKLKDETALEKFTVCLPYCKEMLSARLSGKTIITEEEDMQTDAMVQQLKDSPYTKFIFEPADGVEVYFQQAIYWSVVGVENKALLDIIVVNHNTRTITGWDIKSFEGNFLSNFFRYKYLYQAAWYQSALGYFIEDNPDLLDYEVTNFKFIACDKTLYKNPEIFVVSRMYEDDLWSEENDERITKYRPIPELLEELEYRYSINDWVNSYDMLKYGEITIQML